MTPKLPVLSTFPALTTLDTAVQRTRDLIATSTGVTPDRIKLTTAETFTFPDGSVGCPRPGMSYTQALVPGYRIVMHADGRDYHYHGRQGGEPFYCANPVIGSGGSRDS